MALVEILLPAMGEGIIEATLISWMKNEGDVISVDENLIEVATDKVNSEVPSTASGILHKKLFNDNDVIAVGKPFAIISTDGDATISSPEVKVERTEEKIIPPVVDNKIHTPTIIENKTVDYLKTDKFLSPLVQNIAKEEGLTNQDLESIIGSGKEGRITKDDILAYINAKSNIHTPNAITEHKIEMQKVEIKETTISTTNNASISNENTNIVPMDRMRKLIADHMIKSIQTSAHVCSFIEADLTNIVTWRNENKSKFKEKYGENLTFTPILIEAIAKALVEFPILTASLDGNNIIYKKDINIGMAAALPDGNLIVPVIKNADMLNLLGLAKKVNELGARAKKNQLKPDEIQGGTYTMTNLGSFGNLFGTPIINQPQVAILGVGAIVKKPVVVESNSQESIAIRSMMYLSHSYDHRVIDGFVGGTFVKRVAEILEGFDVNREI
jgi:2-oxoglutarate dehydrogenase E2 component (dihydrolipoamide succinyltransferase)